MKQTGIGGIQVANKKNGETVRSPHSGWTFKSNLPTYLKSRQRFKSEQEDVLDLIVTVLMHIICHSTYSSGSL